MYGTHVLVGEKNGEVLYAVKNNAINLDLYVGELVLIKGTKIHSGLDFGPPYLNVESVTALEALQEENMTSA
jgi:hypothetical protein